MSLHLFARRPPKHARADTDPAAPAPEPAEAPEVAIPLPADLGDGFAAAFGTGQAPPAVRPLPVSPFTGASGTGLMTAPEYPETQLIPEVTHEEPGAAGALELQRARLQEAAPDLLDQMTLIDIPPAVPREKGATPLVPAAWGMAAAVPLERPYAPANFVGTAGQPPAEPPRTYLLAVASGGTVEGTIREPLSGPARSGGLRTDPDGRRVSGAWLGAGHDAWFAFESDSVEAFDVAIAALMDARDALVYGSFPSQTVAANGGAR